MTMAEILERHRNGREAQIGDGELLLPYRQIPEGENTPPEQAPDDPSGTQRGITAKACRHTDQAIEVLVSGIQDEDVRIRMAAAKELLDRGWGNTLAMNADLTDRPEFFDDQSPRRSHRYPQRSGRICCRKRRQRRAVANPGLGCSPMSPIRNSGSFTLPGPAPREAVHGRQPARQDSRRMGNIRLWLCAVYSSGGRIFSDTIRQPSKTTSPPPKRLGTVSTRRNSVRVSAPSIISARLTTPSNKPQPF